jgi:hypothetical protein
VNHLVPIWRSSVAETHVASAPGTWSIWRGLVFLCCPECGQTCRLDDHEIAEDGAIHPSIVCPTDRCTWHMHARLDGWSAEDAAARVKFSIPSPNQESSA